MKTIIFADTAYPVVGGGQIHLHSFYKYLRKKGHQAMVFTNVTEVTAGDGSDYIRVKWPSRNLVALFKLFGTVLKLISSCDIVYCLYSYRLTALAAIAAKIKRKPVYVFAHGLGTIIDPNDPFSHKVYRYISLKLANGVFGSSEELSAISRKFNKNTVTLATGVDSEVLDGHLSPEVTAKLGQNYKDHKVILTVRRLVPKNGIQYLIEAMPFIVERDPLAKYLVVGDGRLREELEKRVRELGLTEQVNFLGEKSNREAHQYMAMAGVVVFPSSAEAMSIACIEAMMIGTPVVAARVGGLVDLLGENNEYGALVDLFGTKTSTYSAPPVSSIPETKYREFGQKILEALNNEDSERLARIKKFARDRYSWSRLIDVILDFSYTKEVEKFYYSYKDDISTKRYHSKYPLRAWAHTSRSDCILNDLGSGRKLLEIGCGDGYFSVKAAKVGFEITATDFSLPNLDQARELAEKEGVSGRIKFVHADAEKLPFKDNEFDIVVASHVLEHLPDFEKGLREVYRITRARAIIALPTLLNPCSMVIIGGGQWWYFSRKGFWSLFVGFLKAVWGILAGKEGIEEGSYGGKHLPHLWRYPWVMRRQLRQAGFKILTFEADSLSLPFFNFFLPLIRFLDRHRANPLLRNLGYGSHAVLRKP